MMLNFFQDDCFASNNNKHGVQENINVLIIKNIPGMKNRTAYVTRLLLIFEFIFF